MLFVAAIPRTDSWTGAFFGVHTAKEYGGYGMLSIGWPLSGLCMCIFSAVLAEMSSSYPVAGAMYAMQVKIEQDAVC